MGAAAIEHLLAEIIDSHVKLDVVVELHRQGFKAKTTRMIADALSMPIVAVAEALSALTQAGVVTTVNEDGAGWRIDPFSGWEQSIASIANLHDHFRLGLLQRITRLALARLRAQGRDTLADVTTIKAKVERNGCKE